MTGSWDKKLRFWDCKQPKPVFELDLGYRIYGADACFPVAVTIGSEKKYSVMPILLQKFKTYFLKNFYNI